MTAPVPFAQCVTMTTSWCLTSAYRLVAAAHAQDMLLDEAQLLDLENLALEHGREASRALPDTVIGGDRNAAIERGVAVARELFEKFRQQRMS